MRRYHFLFFILFLFSSCAIRVNPTGGEKDIKPPVILKAVPENLSVNVKANDIILTFDEFVQLKDINSQLIVSPLLKYTPETKIRKKSLYIHFPDTLEPNTTYTLNFGNSIADNNEGNSLENYQFVFSTGSVVDSLKISGKLEYAFDKKTEKGLVAMLYKETGDSLPFKQRPLYFAKTNDAGEFEISNIAPGEYKLIALEDKDKNYLYTKGEERIGYTENLVAAGSTNVFVRLFKEPGSLRLTKSVSVAPGKVILIFSAAADTVKLNFLTDLAKADIYSQEFSEQKDSLTILYRNADLDSLSFTYFSGKKVDTVDVRLFKKSSQNSSGGNFNLVLTAADRNQSHHLYLPYVIKSNHPLVKLDPAGVVLKRDTIVVSDLKMEFADSLKSSISINSKWSDKGLYELFIPPATVEDIYGLKNDTVKFQWNIRPETYYGTMNLKLNAVKEGLIVQLLDDQEFVYRESFVSADTTIQYSYLDPMLYRIKLIHDANRNRKWDSGEYLKQIQPETVEYYPEKITVRANWDVDVKWDLNLKKVPQK